MILSALDQQQLTQRGIAADTIDAQLHRFATGFPFLKIEAPAAIGKGIIVLDAEKEHLYYNRWKEKTKGEQKVINFVPASGAASRMFKDLFAFLDGDEEVPTTPFEKMFFEQINRFAFYDKLNDKCVGLYQKDIAELVRTQQYKKVVHCLLDEKGLNYGNLPKGLLLFHKSDGTPRTALEEHLVEAAIYGAVNGEAKLHFTVSPEHLSLFQQRVDAVKKVYEDRYKVRIKVSYSTQKPSTDTIAANTDNTPFRDKDNRLVFRPGGHGALIENLNDLQADMIFIKNIDNVVPDVMKDTIAKYKTILAGVLDSLVTRTHSYMQALESETVSDDLCREMLAFLEEELCCKKEGMNDKPKEACLAYLKNKFNRPIRVCGVVKNVGEPGGGPFWVRNEDNSVSLQILESSQIDKHNAEYVKMFQEGTHFNPVDLVCALKDYKGRAFDLPKYVDPDTGFISEKSKDGKPLKALELPGLWNGAMSHWNTVFVEVPLATFNPVKTVNDLLRKEHQGEV